MANVTTEHGFAQLKVPSIDRRYSKDTKLKEFWKWTSEQAKGLQ